MSDLVALADQKLDLAWDARLRVLRSEMETMKSDHAAKGKLYSGATLKGARSICIRHAQEHGSEVRNQYVWVVAQALLATQSWTESLVSAMPARFVPLRREVKASLTALAELIGTPELADQLVTDVAAEIDAEQAKTALALRSAFAEKSRGLIRSAPSAIASAVTKLLRGGG